MGLKDCINEEGHVDLDKVAEMSEAQRATLLQATVILSHIEILGKVVDVLLWCQDGVQSDLPKDVIAARLTEDIDRIMEVRKNMHTQLRRCESVLAENPAKTEG